jgi:hypothetical protein
MVAFLTPDHKVDDLKLSLFPLVFNQCDDVLWNFESLFSFFLTNIQCISPDVRTRHRNRSEMHAGGSLPPLVPGTIPCGFTLALVRVNHPPLLCPHVLGGGEAAINLRREAMCARRRSPLRCAAPPRTCASLSPLAASEEAPPMPCLKGHSSSRLQFLWAPLVGARNAYASRAASACGSYRIGGAGPSLVVRSAPGGRLAKPLTSDPSKGPLAELQPPAVMCSLQLLSLSLTPIHWKCTLLSSLFFFSSCNRKYPFPSFFFFVIRPFSVSIS